MQLVADLVEDGVIGDNQREGHEEMMRNYEQEIVIDLISHQVKNKGKLADQRTVIRFREHARDKLAYWLGNRFDQRPFHDAILALGAVPLPVLEQQIQAYIAERKQFNRAIASFQARLPASSSPEFRPRTPKIGTRWAASPANRARPWR